MFRRWAMTRGAEQSPRQTAQTDGPVATPERARDLVRSIKQQQGPAPSPIHIYLCGGDYFLREPLVLTPADSGTDGAPVIWSAYGDEHPVLSGGQRLTSWTRAIANGREVWTSEVAGRRATDDSRTLAERPATISLPTAETRNLRRRRT